MKNACIKKGRPKGSKNQFLGIGGWARKLGCNEVHLRRVLCGERQSQSLMNRLDALIMSKKSPNRKTRSHSNPQPTKRK
jgi:hypothetical protein